MFVQNLLLACWSCLNGHRARTCNHTTRPLYALKNKGRPRSTTPRSKDSPDILSLHDASFTSFVSTVLNDPILKKEYFHAENPAEKPKRVVPYTTKRTGSKRGAREEEMGGVDIYAGRVGVEEVRRWRELCGLVGVVLGTVAEPPPVPRVVAKPVGSQPLDLAFSSPLTTPDTMNEVLTMGNIPASPLASESLSFEDSEVTMSSGDDDGYSPPPQFFYDIEDTTIDPYLVEMMAITYLKNNNNNNSSPSSSSSSVEDILNFGDDSTPQFCWETQLLRDGQILPTSTQWGKGLERWDQESVDQNSSLFNDLFPDEMFNGTTTGFGPQDNYFNTAECIAH